MASDRQRIDHLFEVGLILLGILSAAEFQYVASTTPLNPFITEEQTMLEISYAFKVLTYPPVVLIVAWLLKELLPRARFPNGRMLLTEFCWGFWGFTLFFFLINFVLFARVYRVNLLWPAIFSLVLTVILIYQVMQAYARALRGIDYFRLRKWRVCSAISFISSYFLLLLIISALPISLF